MKRGSGCCSWWPWCWHMGPIAACGDKFLGAGRGPRFSKVYAAIYPGPPGDVRAGQGRTRRHERAGQGAAPRRPPGHGGQGSADLHQGAAGSRGRHRAGRQRRTSTEAGGVAGEIAAKPSVLPVSKSAVNFLKTLDDTMKSRLSPRPSGGGGGQVMIAPCRRRRRCCSARRQAQAQAWLPSQGEVTGVVRVLGFVRRPARPERPARSQQRHQHAEHARRRHLRRARRSRRHGLAARSSDRGSSAPGTPPHPDGPGRRRYTRRSPTSASTFATTRSTAADWWSRRTSPSVTPSHGYEYFAHAAPGRRVNELQMGA